MLTVHIGADGPATLNWIETYLVDEWATQRDKWFEQTKARATEINKLLAENEWLKNRIAGFEKKDTELRGVIGERNDLTGTLEETNDILRRTRQALDTQIKAREFEYKEYQRQIADLKSQLARTQIDRDCAMQRLAGYEQFGTHVQSMVDALAQLGVLVKISTQKV